MNTKYSIKIPALRPYKPDLNLEIKRDRRENQTFLTRSVNKNYKFDSNKLSRKFSKENKKVVYHFKSEYMNVKDKVIESITERKPETKNAERINLYTKPKDTKEQEFINKIETKYKMDIDVNEERNNLYDLQMSEKGNLMRTYPFKQYEDINREIKGYVTRNIGNQNEVIKVNAWDDTNLNLIKVKIDNTMNNQDILLETQKYINQQLYKKVAYLDQKVKNMSEVIDKMMKFIYELNSNQIKHENKIIIERQMERKHFIDQKAEILEKVDNKIRSFSENHKNQQIKISYKTQLKLSKEKTDIYLYFKGKLNNNKKKVNFSSIMKLKQINPSNKVYIIPKNEVYKNLYLSDYWKRYYLGDFCIITESILSMENIIHNENQISLIVNTKEGQKHLIFFYITELTRQLHLQYMLENTDDQTLYYAIIPRKFIFQTLQSIPNYTKIELLNESNLSYFILEWNRELKGLIIPEILTLHGKAFINTKININRETNIIQVINSKQKEENVNYINSLIRKSKINYNNKMLPAIRYELIDRGKDLIKVDPEIVRLINKAEKYTDLLRYQELSYVPWNKYIFKDIRKLLNLKIQLTTIPYKHTKRFINKLNYIYNFQDNVTKLEDSKSEILEYITLIEELLNKFPVIKNESCAYEKFMSPKATAKDIYGITQKEIVEMIKEKLNISRCTYENVLLLFKDVFENINQFILMTKLVPLAKPGRDYERMEMKHNDIRPLTVQPSILSILDKLCKNIYDKCIIGQYKDIIPTNSFGFIKASSIPYIQLKLLSRIEQFKDTKQDYLIMQFDLEDFYNTITDKNIIFDNKIEEIVFRIYHKEYISFNNQVTRRNIGVPQGSVWSPHFAMKIMRKFQNRNLLKDIMFYVDDGQIVIRFDDTEKLRSKIQKIYNTFYENGITFNLNKLNLIAKKQYQISLIDMHQKIITIESKTIGKCLGVNLNFNGTIDFREIFDKNINFINGMEIKTIDKVTKYRIFTTWIKSRYQTLIPLSVYTGQISELYNHLNILFNFIVYNQRVYKEAQYKYLAEANIFKWILIPALDYISKIFNLANSIKECDKMLYNIIDFLRAYSVKICNSNTFYFRTKIPEKINYLKYQISMFIQQQQQKEIDSLNEKYYASKQLIFKTGINTGFIEENLIDFIAKTNNNSYYAYLYNLMKINLNYVDFGDIDNELFNNYIDEEDINFEEKIIQSLTIKYIFLLKTFEKYKSDQTKRRYQYTTEETMILDKRSIYFWSILKNLKEVIMEDAEELESLDINLKNQIIV